MIGETLSCPVMDYREVTVKALSGYDTIVFGSRAHAGRIDDHDRCRFHHHFITKSHSFVTQSGLHVKMRYLQKLVFGKILFPECRYDFLRRIRRRARYK